MEKSLVKKRGRKPKGGKIIEQNEKHEFEQGYPLSSVQNVILHLKCSKQELEDKSLPVVIEPYNDDTAFEIVDETFNTVEMSLQNKLKEITAAVRNNEIKKKSACFWCTCPYDNQPVRIPKHKVNGQYQVYGSFCCPECAAAFIFAEPTVDNSVKFDRYHLLNYLYGGDHKKNILPAPSPYYFLDKYYGNMDITEYRKMVQSDQLILVVDKPICVLCPEIIVGMKPNEKNVKEGYKLCRKNTAKLEKGSI